MNKKVTLITILILVLGVVISPLTQSIFVKKSNIIISNGKTLYVGGSGPDNYTKIQEAINSALDGDTIFVFSGTYNEKLKIDKSIDLVGENRSSTIIKCFGIDDVIRIYKSWASVRNFYINNSGPYGTHSGIKIKGEINNITIQNNIITDNLIGICIGDEYSSYVVENVRVEGNIIKNNSDGIRLYVSYYTRISNNTFIGNGIVIPDWFTRYNTVVNNTVNGLPLIYLTKETNKIISENAGQIILFQCDNITITSQNNFKHCEYFIILVGCRNCKIVNNTISWKYYFIHCLRSHNNIIQENLVENVIFGVYLDHSDSNIISFNKVNNCRDSILSRNSDRNIISYNSFKNCRDSINLYYSSFNIVSFNLIDNCSENGIETFFTCNFNKFLNNTIYNCRRSGIYLYGSYIIRFDLASNGNIISGNIIENNTVGINVVEASLSKVTMNNVVNNRFGIIVTTSRLSRIFKNNIYDNEEEDAVLKNSFFSRFKGNFWNEKRRIHLISGGIYNYDFWGERWVLKYPLIRFDLHAVKVPYDVGV
jgi:parallel beta-helix repeat protein